MCNPNIVLQSLLSFGSLSIDNGLQHLLFDAEYFLVNMCGQELAEAGVELEGLSALRAVVEGHGIRHQQGDEFRA